MLNEEEIDLSIWIETEIYTVSKAKKKTFYILWTHKFSCAFFCVVFKAEKKLACIVSHTHVSPTAIITSLLPYLYETLSRSVYFTSMTDFRQFLISLELHTELQFFDIIIP